MIILIIIIKYGNDFARARPLADARKRVLPLGRPSPVNQIADGQATAATSTLECRYTRLTDRDFDRGWSIVRRRFRRFYFSLRHDVNTGHITRDVIVKCVGIHRYI